jgi:dipeptidyl aminopeptidase/acylaminoacyl peptidase
MKRLLVRRAKEGLVRSVIRSKAIMLPATRIERGIGARRRRLGIAILLIALVVSWLITRPRTAAQEPAAPAKPSRLVIYREPSQGGVSTERGLAILDPLQKKAEWVHRDKTVSMHLRATVSPDGRQVAYGLLAPNSSGGRGPEADVFVKALDDAKPGRSLEVQAYFWCWSPDGKRLVAYSETDGGWQHHLVDVQTKEKTPLHLPNPPEVAKAKFRAGHTVCDWSSDGQWFLTCYLPPDEIAKPQLFRIKHDGSAVRPIEGIGPGGNGRFSPDGKQVLYMKRIGDGQFQLHTASVEGGKPRPIAHERDGHIVGFCWSPDGKRIAYDWHKHPEPGDADAEGFVMVVNADGSDATVLYSEKTSYGGLRVVGWK